MSKDPKTGSSKTTVKQGSKEKATYNIKKSINEIKPGDIIITKNSNFNSFRKFFGVGNANSKGDMRTADEWNSVPHPELVLEVDKIKKIVKTVQVSSFNNAEKLANTDPKIGRDKWKYLIPVDPNVKESSEQPFTVDYKYKDEKYNDQLKRRWISVHTTSEIAPFYFQGRRQLVRTFIRVLLTLVTYSNSQCSMRRLTRPQFQPRISPSSKS